MTVNESVQKKIFDEGEIRTLYFCKAAIEGVLWFILAAITYHKFDTVAELITHLNSWHVDNLYGSVYLIYFIITMITFFLIHFTSLALLKLALCFRK